MVYEDVLAVMATRPEVGFKAADLGAIFSHTPRYIRMVLAEMVKDGRVRKRKSLYYLAESK